MGDTESTCRESGPFLAGSVRVVRAQWPGPSWIARSLAASAMVVLVLVALALLIPAAVVGAAALGLWFIRVGVRRMFSSACGPNGALDGRRNVRVIIPNRGR